jgi:hypothetical protein
VPLIVKQPGQTAGGVVSDRDESSGGSSARRAGYASSSPCASSCDQRTPRDGVRAQDRHVDVERRPGIAMMNLYSHTTDDRVDDAPQIQHTHQLRERRPWAGAEVALFLAELAYDRPAWSATGTTRTTAGPPPSSAPRNPRNVDARRRMPPGGCCELSEMVQAIGDRYPSVYCRCLEGKQPREPQRGCAPRASFSMKAAASDANRRTQLSRSRAKT